MRDEVCPVRVLLSVGTGPSTGSGQGGQMPATEQLVMKAVDYPGLDRVAQPVSGAVRRAFESAGPVGRHLKNALHGTWLGHPLHPVFTDVPLGAWTTALALDLSAGRDR